MYIIIYNNKNVLKAILYTALMFNVLYTFLYTNIKWSAYYPRNTSLPASCIVYRTLYSLLY